MRISDWSSDVCSSDLTTLLAGTIAGVYAQKGKLNQAKSSYENYYAMSSLQQTEEAQKSLKEAKTTIEEVVLHDKTSSSPEAFLYKSLIYSALANDTTMQDAATDAIQISFRSEERRVGKECVST